ncbi:phage virion morphogenesis protein [Cypionkella psychrotolerans]|uniref:phage virion morphogenesis protein n=1 Tax=Cypionkella psychrotolerans TaxID=1678131 RepID=UPI0006B5625C|nr:phage virion morphogenesis protein [Cypionkella psychrotolerans]
MFTIELKDDQITAALARALAQQDDLSPLTDQIGEILVVSVKDRFKAGESPDGVKWAAKSPVTLAAYGARKSNRIDARPLFGPSGMLNAQIFAETSSDGVLVGSGRVQAAMMQFGGAKAAFPHLWGNIPARPFLGFSDQDRVNILGEAEDWLMEAFSQP